MRDFVTGTSVVSFRYKDGIIMGADAKASYGRLTKFNGVQRMFKFGSRTLVGISGEVSDMQYLIKTLNILTEEDNREIDPKGYHKMVQRILYSARSRISPLNLSVCVGGVKTVRNSEEEFETNEKTLGCVDRLGNFYFSDVICTGIGSYLALPFLRSKVEGREQEITREEAIRLVEEAMEILCYRDCNASNEVQIGYADSQGVHISDPYLIKTNWDVGVREDEIVIE
ncbi:proteasome type-4 subunit beta [Encephalitozoon intestinalis ATCC 50506]|uniref:Proteasome subunit beta n=1 Tax=Encephalitozoon intestinalis (strain ATCC 50506) TaxID=876142 RepID=E0S748_ENCIT|nr:proteasome type-4 subunit beta [Encephalitozoon intestinalis ATCC 50506]ADM11476.2 proteasome type-4 subunit beta [Encephalitozoon intestinalis ATCC 50506]UTX45188.1 proteasome type-4 subunit beta [Encephalitozoon intestinalis]